MSKFMKQEDREQQVKDLMLAIRRNTQGSKCIEIFERLLNEIPDKDFVDTVVVDTHRFITDFFCLFFDVDNMKNLDFISRILTYDFIQPYKCFYKSRKTAQLYLYMNDMLLDKYQHPVYTVEKKIMLPNENSLGNIYHKSEFTADDVVTLFKHFGDLSGLSVEEVKEKKELARMVVLLYNYIPAIVKALIQTKRRGLKLDKNSKMFE